MKDDNLKHAELELISAYVDGELPEAQARKVARRIKAEPTWAAAAEEITSLDALLETWTPPRLQRDLTGSILAATLRKPKRPQWLKWVPPMAAAASIALAAWLGHGVMPRPSGQLAAIDTVDAKVTQAIEALSPEDRFVVENLDLFQDYAVVPLAAAAEATPPAPSNEPVSVEHQLRLKRELLLGQQSLLASLQTNRDSWDRATPGQRQELRNRAYAFRNADPAEQQEVLAAWERFMAMENARRQEYRAEAEALKAVLDTLGDQQKQKLLDMSPTARTRELQRITENLAKDEATTTP